MNSYAIRRSVFGALFCAAVALLVAALALAGYVVGVRSLASVGTNLRAMSPVTAFCLIGLSVSLTAATFGRIMLMRVAAVLVILTSLLVLFEQAVMQQDRISPLVAQALFGRSADFAGRMSVATALGMVLVACALFTQRAWRLAADICAATALVIAATALFGYGYNISALYALPIFSTMAVNTAAALFLLSVAVLMIEPMPARNKARIGPAGGNEGLLRRSTVIVIPVLADWLLVSGTSNSPLGNLVVALLVLISGSIPISLMILRDSRSFRGSIGEVIG